MSDSVIPDAALAELARLAEPLPPGPYKAGVDVSVDDHKRDIRLAYGRGYNTGMGNRWPLYHPPRPPDAVVARLMDALQELADAVAAECGKFDEDDPMAVYLDGYVDRAYGALEAVGRFVRKSAPEPTP